MELDREQIVRRDFPSGQPGYEAAAVVRHLEEIADAVARQPSAAASLSGTVQGVIEAAEQAAAEIEREAHARAAQIHEEATTRAGHDAARIAGATQELAARAEEIERELQELFGELATRGRAIGAAMAALERDIQSSDRPGLAAEPLAPPAVASAPHVPERSARAAGHSQAGADSSVRQRPDGPGAEQPAGDTAKPDHDRPAVPREPAGVGPPLGAGGDAPGNGSQAAEDARLVALDMALDGTSRAEIDAYLAAHFELEDRAKLLDEVLAAVGG
ncbi:MAG: hypothetical protein NVSMB51_15310 [Solirubrobacteraceae bacterium]